jgi:UDP-3-O-[3-hydroxymyristoyl] glucosamine N-acyltransferase LpxD
MGQKKKVLMAFALACGTRYLLMDEPTNGLDIASKKQFRKVIASNMTDERTIVIATHQVHDVEQLLDHILIISEDGMQLNASVADITDKYVFEVRPSGQLDDTIIYAGAKIYEGVEIGRRCILHAGCVVGSDGFGFAPDGNGGWNKIDQIGNVILEGDVEVGANTCIDRAAMKSTILHQGVKVDNLCQIAHNVVIGRNTAMASQVGIAGSCKVGEECIIAGQAGLVGHITVGDHVTIGAQSGVTHSVPGNQTIFGSPAMESSKRRKVEVLVRNIEKLAQRIENLEKK